MAHTIDASSYSARVQVRLPASVVERADAVSRRARSSVAGCFGERFAEKASARPEILRRALELGLDQLERDLDRSSRADGSKGA